MSVARRTAPARPEADPVAAAATVAWLLSIEASETGAPRSCFDVGAWAPHRLMAMMALARSAHATLHVAALWAKKRVAPGPPDPAAAVRAAAIHASRSAVVRAAGGTATDDPVWNAFASIAMRDMAKRGDLCRSGTMAGAIDAAAALHGIIPRPRHGDLSRVRDAAVALVLAGGCRDADAAIPILHAWTASPRGSVSADVHDAFAAALAPVAARHPAWIDALTAADAAGNGQAVGAMLAATAVLGGAPRRVAGDLRDAGAVGLLAGWSETMEPRSFVRAVACLDAGFADRRWLAAGPGACLRILAALAADGLAETPVRAG